MVVFYLCISLALIRNSLLSLIIIGLLKSLLPSPARHSSPHIMNNHRLGSCFLALATFILHRSALRNNSDY